MRTDTEGKIRPAYQVAFTGMLFALSMALAFLEGLLPTVAFLPPGVKLGLSNIITMYALFCVGEKRALLIAVLKSIFVLLTRGTVAGILSLSGGILSVAVMVGVSVILKEKVSYLTVSILGAVFHNIGQLVAASFLLQTEMALYYLPVLILSGIGMGLITGLTVRVVMPVLNRLQNKIR